MPHRANPEVARRAVVRPREDADAEALVAGLATVHEIDAYPLMGEHVTAEWLYGDQDAAWVAVIDDAPVGHVAVKSGFGSAATQEALGRPASQILGVTRFFIAPAGRGTGAGSALLDAVDTYAAENDLALALDVVEHNLGAIGVYERRGWERVGEFAADWFGPNGPHPQVFYYVKPGRPASG